MAEDPLCWYYLQRCKVTAADIVDHIKPHHGNEALFFDYDNLRSSDKRCHDSAAAIMDHTGYVPGAGADKLPLAPEHPFYRQGPR